jgi:hypothetical protein
MTATAPEPVLRVLPPGGRAQSSTLLLLACRAQTSRFDRAVFAEAGWGPAVACRYLHRPTASPPAASRCAGSRPCLCTCSLQTGTGVWPAATAPPSTRSHRSRPRSGRCRAARTRTRARSGPRRPPRWPSASAWTRPARPAIPTWPACATRFHCSTSAARTTTTRLGDACRPTARPSEPMRSPSTPPPGYGCARVKATRHPLCGSYRLREARVPLGQARLRPTRRPGHRV